MRSTNWPFAWATFIAAILFCAVLRAQNPDDAVLESAYSGDVLWEDFAYASGSGRTCSEARADAKLRFVEKTSDRLRKCESEGGTGEIADPHQAAECLYAGHTSKPYLFTRWGRVSCSE